MSTRKTDVIALQKIMVERGVKNTSELARLSGIGRNTLSDVLHGKIQPSASVMTRLIEALQIEPKVAGEIFFTRDLRIA